MYMLVVKSSSENVLRGHIRGCKQMKTYFNLCGVVLFNGIPFMCVLILKGVNPKTNIEMECDVFAEKLATLVMIISFFEQVNE